MDVVLPIFNCVVEVLTLAPTLIVVDTFAVPVTVKLLLIDVALTTSSVVPILKADDIFAEPVIVTCVSGVVLLKPTLLLAASMNNVPLSILTLPATVV